MPRRAAGGSPAACVTTSAHDSAAAARSISAPRSAVGSCAVLAAATLRTRAASTAGPHERLLPSSWRRMTSRASTGIVGAAPVWRPRGRGSSPALRTASLKVPKRRTTVLVEGQLPA